MHVNAAMMKLRSSRVLERQDQSPFLQQAEANEVRPKLKFDSPEKTEEWLATREKTDYTYSRSASYTINGSPTGYSIPIMSRVSQTAFMRDTSSSSPARRSQVQQEALTASPNRRSSRLAKKQGLNESAGSRLNQSQTRSTQVSHSTSYTSSNLRRVSSPVPDRCDNDASSSEESVWPSMSRTAAPSHFASSSLNALTSGIGSMYHQMHHHTTRGHSINHMYGLDGNEESELSDTESSSAVTAASRTSSRTIMGSHAHHHAQSSSLLLLPVTFLITIVTSIVSTITTVTHTSYAYLARASYGSSSYDAMRFDRRNTLASKIGNTCSSLLQLMSVGMYRFVTYLMRMDVWWLIFTKRTALSLIGGLASLLGLSQADQSMSATTSALLLEKKRKRRSCCLCLLLLLGTLASTYLLLGVVPFLFGGVSRNETKEDSPFHTVNQQFGLLLGMIGPSSSDEGGDPGGTAGFIPGSGCLQCLKQDDLMALIGVMVGDQVGDLRSEVAAQKQQILAMQELRKDQESQIKSLQDKIGILITQQGNPNDRTLLYFNTMEGQLTRVRGQLRSLQLGRLQGYRDAENDDTERSEIILSLSGDVNNLGKEVASLQADLESFHQERMLKMNSAEQENSELSSSYQLLHISMLSWEERLATNVTFLEMKLKGLLADIEVLKSEGKQSNSMLLEFVERVNSFESGFADVKSEVRDMKSKFDEYLAERDIREKERAAAMESSLELLRRDFDSLRGSHADAVLSLDELRNKYQGLSVSLGEVKSDTRNLQISVEDLSSGRVGALASIIEQLNNKLAKLDQDFSSLQANFQSLQGSASGMVDKSGFEGLRASLTHAEEQLNVFVSDVDSLKAQASQLRTQVEDVRTSHEEHRAQAGVVLRELKTDMRELTIKSDRMVVLENTQGSADSDSLIKQLSEELGSVRVDVSRVSSLEGDSELVAEVENLKSSLKSAQSQINYFEGTQMQMTRTYTSSISDVRDGIGQANRAIEDQKADVNSLNLTVVALNQAQNKLAAFATRKQLEDLEKEMLNIKTLIDKLSAAQSIYASTGDINVVKTQLTHVKSEIDTMQVQLTEFSDAYIGDSAAYNALAADLTKLQNVVQNIETMLYNADHQPINLSLLESQIKTLTSTVEDNDKDLAAFLAVSGGRVSSVSNDAIVALQQDLTALRAETDRLSGLVSLQTIEGDSSNVVVALVGRMDDLEASVADLRAGGLGVGSNGDVRFQKLQGDINNLKEELMKQNTLHAAGVGVGGFGASMQGAMKEIKANISRLQVDVYNCCKNKTGLLGWWSSPWFGGGQGSSAGTVNISASGMDEEAVKHIILSALNMYSADKTGMVDYALESAGGSVISTRCSETHYSKTALLSIFGIPLWYMANSPRTVIQPDVQPGNCWAFKGSQGYIVIQLAGIIKPSAFSMEHIPKSLSPTGTIDSAPKEFSVWGLTDEEDTVGVLLGEYVYEDNDAPLQFFPIEKDYVEPIPAVELKIHSNHGNLEYTCLYRFRVHGTLDRR